MKKATKNLLLASGIAAITAVAVTALYKKSIQELMKIALDREESTILQRNKQKLTGGSSRDLSDVINKVMQASEELRSSETETVEITADDGIRLIGHYHAGKNPRRVLVAMHGWRSSWSQDFGIISKFWRENGCAVLYPEQRGQGQSGGDYMGFGLLERHDCLSWIKWVHERTGGKLPIYPVGISMGATTVMMTAGSPELPSSVAGIAADCGFGSSVYFCKIFHERLGISPGEYRTLHKR